MAKRVEDVDDKRVLVSIRLSHRGYDIHELDLFQLWWTNKLEGTVRTLMHRKYYQHKVNLLLISGKLASATNVSHLRETSCGYNSLPCP